MVFKLHRRGLLSQLTLSIFTLIAVWSGSIHLEGLTTPAYADDIKPKQEDVSPKPDSSGKKKDPNSGSHNEKETPTPEDPPWIYDREQLVRMSDKFAIEKLRFADINGNGIPDYREFYRVNYHDCTSHSATFDYILEEMGKAGVLNKEQAFGAGQIRGGNHAANYVPGLDVVDVTPIRVSGGYVASQGRPFYNFPRGTMFYQQGFPDAGEFTFAGYRGPMSNTIPGVPMPGGGGGIGGGGGGGLFGGGGSGNMMGMLGQLLAGKNGNSSSQSGGAVSSRPPANQGAKPPPGNSGGQTPPKQPANPTTVPSKETPTTPGSSSSGDQKPPVTTPPPGVAGTPNPGSSASTAAKKKPTQAIDSMILGGSVFDTTKKPSDEVSRPATWDIPVNPTPKPLKLPAASGQNLFERQ